MLGALQFFYHNITHDNSVVRQCLIYYYCNSLQLLLKVYNATELMSDSLILDNIMSDTGTHSLK